MQLRHSARTRLAAIVVASCAIAAVTAPSAEAQSSTLIEADVNRVLTDDAAPFDQRTALADRLRAEMTTQAATDARGRTALLWIRAMRHALKGIPMDGQRYLAPFRSWIDRHETEVIYSEPAGEWLMDVELIWRTHDANRSSSSAEAIAWEAVENGLSGECEGYPPCYLVGLDKLHGEYLRRHPRGAHAQEALKQVRESCDQSLQLLSTQDDGEFFNPDSDCQDLVPAAASLRTALRNAGRDAAPTLASLDALRRKCP